MDYASMYGQMHENEKHLAGKLEQRSIDSISTLVRETFSTTLLDYGSGKGYQYLAQRAHMNWGILPVCYDIGVRQLSTKPVGTFDGVICTDMLEHIEESDLPAVLADIFGYATRFVYLLVSCVPATKSLPDGRNAHLTVRPPSWWRNLLTEHNREGLRVVVDFAGSPH